MCMPAFWARRPRSRSSDAEDLLGEVRSFLLSCSLPTNYLQFSCNGPSLILLSPRIKKEKDGARFKAAPPQARNVVTYLLGALLCTCIGIYGYQHWADSHRLNHPACNASLLHSECAWELGVGLPLSLSYWLLLLWVHCLSSSNILPHGGALDIPYHPTRRTYYIRLIKAIAVFYLMLYPAVHQVFFLLLSRDSSSSFPARFSVFLMRQVSVMCALFAVVFSWTRRRRDSLAAQLYWIMLSLLYVLQASLTSWHAQNAALSYVFYIASLPHIVLLVCIFSGACSFVQRLAP